MHQYRPTPATIRMHAVDLACDASTIEHARWLVTGANKRINQILLRLKLASGHVIPSLKQIKQERKLKQIGMADWVSAESKHCLVFNSAG